MKEGGCVVKMRLRFTFSHNSQPMEITLNRKSALVMSPFGRRTRPFQDAGAHSTKLTIPPGKSLPDLARKYYDITEVFPFKAMFPFLDRDNKQRAYDPGKEDKFVFASAQSLKQFNDHALKLIHNIINQWKSLDLPTMRDEERGIEAPDSDKIWSALDPTHDLHRTVIRNMPVIMFLLSNYDIMKKACIVRSVIPGWWAQSYAGQYSGKTKEFSESIDALVTAINKLSNGSEFKKVRAATAADLGDPLDTNVGFPYFSSQIDKAGNPIAKLKVIHLFKGIGTQNYDLDKLFAIVAKRVEPLGLQNHPFLIAPIRRLQPGYKWNHVFRETSMGLETDYDERGNNTIRIAWMSPYILNLFLSPLQLEWKAVRKLLPGLFHDGDAKRKRLHMIRAQGKFIAEADYSNYDRNIPVDIFLEFAARYLKTRPHSQFWYKLLHSLHHKMPIIWPDYVGGEKGRGWVFTPKILGLLSGLKITSEEGTFVNAIVTGQALMDTGMTQSGLVQYYTQYLSGSPGSKFEHVHIQSDDTLLIANDPLTLKKLGDAFKARADQIGLPGSLTLGDRFLMRHNNDGRDTPVPARVWQNTLSNEEPYEDALTFAAGLAMRTDGLLGHKTYDPFATGTRQKVTRSELLFTLDVLLSLQKFTGGSSVVIRPVVQFLDLLTTACRYMLTKTSDDLTSTAVIDAEDATKIDLWRKDTLRQIAERDQAELAGIGDHLTIDAIRTLVYDLHKNIHTPSAQQLLAILLQSGNPVFQRAIKEVSLREQRFYQYALNEIGIPLEL